MKPISKKKSGPPSKVLEVKSPSMNKKSTLLDGDHSHMSVRMEEVEDSPKNDHDRKKWKKKLSKKDSLYFRPNENDCKVIEVIVLKVWFSSK
jgi:gluconate kinase